MGAREPPGEDALTVYTVTGYQRTVVLMKVEADSPEEAIQRAKDGDYTNADTEPNGWLYRPAWTAQEGHHVTAYRP